MKKPYLNLILIIWMVLIAIGVITDNYSLLLGIIALQLVCIQNGAS